MINFSSYSPLSSLTEHKHTRNPDCLNSQELFHGFPGKTHKTLDIKYNFLVLSEDYTVTGGLIFTASDKSWFIVVKRSFCLILFGLFDHKSLNWYQYPYIFSIFPHSSLFYSRLYTFSTLPN